MPTGFQSLQCASFTHAPPVFRSARRPKPRTPQVLFATILAAGLLGPGNAGAAGFLNPCTGISLPRSSVFNYLNPVLGPLFNAPLLGPLLGLTGLGPVYAGLATGQPLSLSLLDNDGVLLSPGDDCKLATDGYSLNVDQGISIGGNSITGLGTKGGTPAIAGAKNAIAIGDGATTGAAAPDALALGSNASVANNAAAAGAVALGAGSVATGSLAAAYVPVGGTYAVAGNGAGANRELSIGTTGNERRITHVAAGGADTDAVNISQLKSAVSAVDASAVKYDTTTKELVTLQGTASTDGGLTNGTKITNVAQGTLSATSTDAVNGAQLFATNRNIGSVVNVFGGNAMINFDGTVTGPTYTLSTITAGGGTTVGNYTTVGDALTALGSSVINLSQNVNNSGTGGTSSKYMQVTSTLGGAAATSSDSVAIGPQAVASGVSSIAMGNGAQATGNGGVALGAGAVASRAGMGGQAEALSGVTVTSTQGAVSVGAVGSERQITNLAGGTQATDAVNLRQLQAVQAGSVSYTAGPDGAVNYNQVTLGNGQAPNGTVISNVAPGVSSGDAVNVQQLTSGVAAANQYTDARVNQFQQGMQNVADKAYAGVAAAMAMESPPYVPGKVSYAAGLGHYQGQSAVGVSLRRTAVNGRWSFTGGVSATGVGGVAARVGISGIFE